MTAKVRNIQRRANLGAKVDPVILDWARNVAEEVIECRDTKHPWKSSKPGVPVFLLWEIVRTKTGVNEWQRLLICTRCGHQRRDRKEYPTGYRLPSEYIPKDPAPGKSEYYIPAGHGRLSAADLFRISLAMGEAQRPAAEAPADKSPTSRRSPRKRKAS